MHDGVPTLIVCRGQRLFAMVETCSHFRGPLSEGKLVDGSIECPYHASRFALEDGRLINGPAEHLSPPWRSAFGRVRFRAANLHYGRDGPRNSSKTQNNGRIVASLDRKRLRADRW